MKKIFTITLLLFALAGLAHADYAHTSTLRVGSRGAAVTSMQDCLNHSGYSVGTADGIFGPMTASAVRDFQSSRGLAADAIVGPMTGSAMTAACMTTTSDEDVETDEPSVEDVEDTNEGDTADKSSHTVDGFNALGDHAATVEFEFPIKNDGDFDVDIDGLDDIIFKIRSTEYTATALEALPGYILTVEFDDVEITDNTTYTIGDGNSDDIRIKVIVAAGETVLGTGEYELELDRIEYTSAGNPNGKLYLNMDADEIDLLAS